MTLEKETREITPTGIKHLFTCNHEEADTRVIYHCTLDDKPIVVIATDSDILMLMVDAFAYLLPNHDWFLQTHKKNL